MRGETKRKEKERYTEIKRETERNRKTDVCTDSIEIGLEQAPFVFFN